MQLLLFFNFPLTSIIAKELKLIYDPGLGLGHGTDCKNDKFSCQGHVSPNTKQVPHV